MKMSIKSNAPVDKSIKISEIVLYSENTGKKYIYASGNTYGFYYIVVPASNGELGLLKVNPNGEFYTFSHSACRGDSSRMIEVQDVLSLEF